MKIKCPNCGKEHSKWPKAIEKGWLACSRECQYKLARVKRYKKVCLTCSKEFKLTKNGLRGGRGKYCCRECFYKSSKHPRKRVLCQFCREEMEVTHGQFKRGKKYCSKDCQKKAMGWNRNGGTKNCLRCDKEFYTMPSKSGRKFCSIECKKMPIDKCKNCGKVERLRFNRFCHKCYRRDYQYKIKYGVSLNFIEPRLLDGCEICGNKEKKYLRVDHDHKNGKFRGILCNNCNSFLGYAKDNQNNLVKAIKYLGRQDGRLDQNT